MIDLSGKRFGRLVVLERYGSDKSKNATWKCKCDCGHTIILSGIYLRNGDTKSCGCLRKEMARDRMSTHGQSKTRLYKVWAGIKTRCYNKNSDNYKYYGAKGIKMCEDWRLNFEIFRDWALKNGYNEDAAPGECTIDRVDNQMDYSPENCRWVSHASQCNNQTSNRVFSHNGKSMTMAEWAVDAGIKYTTLRARIRRGIPLEEAIKTHK